MFIGKVEQTSLSSNSVFGLLGLLWWSYFPGFVSLSIKIVLNKFINNLISCATGMGFSGFYQILGIRWNFYLYLWISPIFKRCQVILGASTVMSVISTCSFGFSWHLYHLQCFIAIIHLKLLHMSNRGLIELSGEWRTTRLFRNWLGAVRHQAITWANVDRNLCHYKTSPGHNKLICLSHFQYHQCFCHNCDIPIQYIHGLHSIVFLPSAPNYRSVSVYCPRASTVPMMCLHAEAFIAH